MALEFEKTYDLIRVYFNAHGSVPWSVDDGNQENETSAPMVVTQGISRYVYLGGEPNPDYPIAWVEYRKARVRKVNESKERFLLFIDNSDEY